MLDPERDGENTTLTVAEAARIVRSAPTGSDALQALAALIPDRTDS